MGVLPDGVKRWGSATVLKESARLLHKHGRLFLPFYLAFIIPASILSVLQTAFLSPSGKPHHYFVNSHLPQDDSDTSDTSEPLLPSLVCTLLVLVLTTLATAAFAYTVAYIYTESDTDDRSVVKKIFKLLPHAFVRIFVTSLWVFLAFFLLYLACLPTGAVLYFILSSISRSSAIPIVVLVLMLLLLLSGVITVSIMFAFGKFVAVLEPESYGREALKKSMKLVKAGGVRTLFAIFVVYIVAVGVLFSVPTHAIAAGTLPLWEAIVLGVVMVALDSVMNLYFGVVPIVLYFVYKSRFDAVFPSIPEFQIGDAVRSADNAYKPLVPGSDYPKSMAEA